LKKLACQNHNCSAKIKIEDYSMQAVLTKFKCPTKLKWGINKKSTFFQLSAKKISLKLFFNHGFLSFKNEIIK